MLPDFLTSINFWFNFCFLIYFFRLYDVYAFKKERASPFTSHKGKLVDYLLRVTRDNGEKNYLCQLQHDIEDSIEYILQIWMLYVSVKIFLTFSHPSFHFFNISFLFTSSLYHQIIIFFEMHFIFDIFLEDCMIFIQKNSMIICLLSRAKFVMTVVRLGSLVSGSSTGMTV